MSLNRNIPIKMGDFSVIDTEFSNIRERFDAEMRKMEEEMSKFRSELMNRESNNFFRSTTRYLFLEIVCFQKHFEHCAVNDRWQLFSCELWLPFMDSVTKSVIKLTKSSQCWYLSRLFVGYVVWCYYSNRVQIWPIFDRYCHFHLFVSSCESAAGDCSFILSLFLLFSNGSSVITRLFFYRLMHLATYSIRGVVFCLINAHLQDDTVSSFSLLVVAGLSL